MLNYVNCSPLRSLPIDIQNDWRAILYRVDPTDEGVIRLVHIERTSPLSSMGQRITVLVVDEDFHPIPNVPVGFGYSTAPKQLLITEEYLWTPPIRKIFEANTTGAGMIDQIQGSGVKADESGGITVFVNEPKYSSDFVVGAGMLADHTGLYMVFQLFRTGVIPLAKRLELIESRLTALESK